MIDRAVGNRSVPLDLNGTIILHGTVVCDGNAISHAKRSVARNGQSVPFRNGKVRIHRDRITINLSGRAEKHNAIPLILFTDIRNDLCENHGAACHGEVSLVGRWIRVCGTSADSISAGRRHNSPCNGNRSFLSIMISSVTDGSSVIPIRGRLNNAPGDADGTAACRPAAADTGT